jgi:hypothetical protein
MANLIQIPSSQTITDKKGITRQLNKKELFWLDVLNKGIFTQNKDGQFFWAKKMPKTKSRIGNIAGCISQGYVIISLQERKIERKILGHQLSFLLKWGYIGEIIDHIDHDKSNNRPDNLRHTTHAENLQNQNKAQKGSISETIGVSQQKKNNKWTGKWRAYITIDKKQIVKLFDSIEEASIWRNKMVLLHYTHSPINKAS